jgi:hypothetical protein
MILVSCAREPKEVSPPTPTPLPGGDIFFEPARDLAETRAIEVVLISFTDRHVPIVEHSVVITEPKVLQGITSTLLNVTFTACTQTLPMLQQSDYGVRLYLYSREEILPSSATCGQWMLANVDYYSDINYIGFYRPDGLGGRQRYYCPVRAELEEILERALTLRGLDLP